MARSSEVEKYIRQLVLAEGKKQDEKETGDETEKKPEPKKSFHEEYVDSASNKIRDYVVQQTKQHVIRYMNDPSFDGKIDVHALTKQLAKEIMHKLTNAFKGGEDKEALKEGMDMDTNIPDVNIDEAALDEKTPEGMEYIVKGIKKSKSATNPYAVAWSMKNAGFTKHKGPKAGHHVGGTKGESTTLTMDMIREMVERAQSNLTEGFEDAHSIATELFDYIQNTASLQPEKDRIVSLMVKQPSPEGARKFGWSHLVANGVKTYAQEFGQSSIGSFTPEVREICEEMLHDYYKTEIELGNYDNLR